VYYETPRLKGHIMTRILVSTIKTVTFILGIVLASCFIGRGANNRMKHVLTVQQRFITRRDNRLNRW
jgi:lipoprotein